MTDSGESDGLASRSVLLRLKEGLHIRPCSMIAKVAARAEGVVLESGGQSADAASIFDLLALALESGAEVVIRGPQAAAAQIDEIADLFESDFPAK